MERLRARMLTRLRGDRGSSSMEFLFITPLAFLLLMLVVQFGLYYFASTVNEAAAQAGARKARATADANPGSWQGRARDTAQNRINTLGPSLVGDPAIDTVQDGQQVGVTVTARVRSVVPWMHLTVTSKSIGPIERFVPDAG
ncbi:TadE family protein [Kitasatospora sp. NPDC127060]|uniref:TadE family protein n=1 Tax=Kitasatospora sp. NPDC127060 TaxID=3347121 RepID=UPI00365639C4